MTNDLETLYIAILKKGLTPKVTEESGSYRIDLQLPGGKTVDRVTLVPNEFLNALSFPEQPEGGFSNFFQRLGDTDAFRRGEATRDGADTSAPPPVPIFTTAGRR